MGPPKKEVERGFEKMSSKKGAVTLGRAHYFILFFPFSRESAPRGRALSARKVERNEYRRALERERDFRLRDCNEPRRSRGVTFYPRPVAGSFVALLPAPVPQGAQYRTRKPTGSSPSKANPGSSGLFERAAAACAAAAAAPPAVVAEVDCAFGDEGRALLLWISCLPVRPARRCMNEYIVYEEGAGARKKKEGGGRS